MAMISNMYPRTMSRYNRWQNQGLFRAAGTLTEGDRMLDRAAFWGSIHGTLSHLYWADQIWLSRFGLIDPPGVPLKQSVGFIPEWSELAEKRSVIDDLIVTWADSLALGPVNGTLKWFSGAAGRDVEAPLAIVVAHIFNHQTHHRGQAHAMVTAAGGITIDTDLFLMPPAQWPR